MNTPEPCDTCNHLYYNCMTEDDPTDSAECKLNKEMGIDGCPFYQRWVEKIPPNKR